MDVLEAMVVFIFNSRGGVLLGEKQTKYCAGYLVGPGGKREIGETLHTASVRETEEECGLTPVLSDPLGVVICHNLAGMPDIIVYMYRTTGYQGQVQDSPTLQNLCWYPITPDTVNRMMDGDRTWFHHLVAGTPFKAEIWYDQSWHMIDHRVSIENTKPHSS